MRSLVIGTSDMKVEASVARRLRAPPDGCDTVRTSDWSWGPLTRPPQPEQSCRWQLLHWPDNGGTMPSKRPSFTPSSILFRPRQSPARWVLVEAPGTAPGSDGFIPTLVYRHSRLATAPRI